MKFFHLSDLHFGKQLHGYDLGIEQSRCIQDILEAARRELPDAIIIAGDIYDRSVPSGNAMTLLEELFLGLDEISEKTKQIEILVIAGNHDSAQRLRYGSSFLKRHHIHIAVAPPQEEGERLQKVLLTDEYGAVNFYLLPYTRPGMIRHLAPEGALMTTEAAVRYLLEQEKIDWTQRNVLVSHQFYVSGGTQPLQCDSEAPCLSVGGLDAVDIAAVGQFDYVALGHIHSPQKLGVEKIRYCGTMYPYSVSEAGQEKSITVVEMGKKGELKLRFLPFCPERTVRCLRGTLEEIVANASKAGEAICHDYVSIVLTDEETVDSPKDYLEHYYDHILEIRMDNRRTRQILEEEYAEIRELTPLEAFESFFSDVTGRSMNVQEKEALQDILKEID